MGVRVAGHSGGGAYAQKMKCFSLHNATELNPTKTAEAALVEALGPVNGTGHPRGDAPLANGPRRYH